MRKRILFVEDDAVIRENYSELLGDEGFEVAGFNNRHQALEFVQTQPPDLALLDISLGDERDAGFQLCADLRQRWPQLPIIFLTSHDSDIDKISGFRLGADDYLTKDVSVNYLVVRMEALLRRIQALTAETKPGPKPPKQGPSHLLQMDHERLAAYWREHKLELNLTQYWLLTALVNDPGQVKSYDQLMRAANLQVEPNTITAHIKTIRDRFKIIDPAFNYIQTERGRGYRWVD